MDLETDQIVGFDNPVSHRWHGVWRSPGATWERQKNERGRTGSQYHPGYAVVRAGTPGGCECARPRRRPTAHAGWLRLTDKETWGPGRFVVSLRRRENRVRRRFCGQHGDSHAYPHSARYILEHSPCLAHANPAQQRNTRFSSLQPALQETPGLLCGLGGSCGASQFVTESHVP